MATRKRTTHRQMTAFIRRRAKLLRLNPAVPLAIEKVFGCSFCRTWQRMKFAVLDRWLKRVDGGKRYV